MRVTVLIEPLGKYLEILDVNKGGGVKQKQNAQVSEQRRSVSLMLLPEGIFELRQQGLFKKLNRPFLNLIHKVIVFVI